MAHGATVDHLRAVPSQCRELKLVRQDDPVWAGAHRSPAVATLKRVELASQAFFRRVKAGVNGGGKVGHVGGSIVDSPSPSGTFCRHP